MTHSPLIDRIYSRAGAVVAAQIQAEFGGCNVYIPALPSNDPALPRNDPALPRNEAQAEWRGLATAALLLQFSTHMNEVMYSAVAAASPEGHREALAIAQDSVRHFLAAREWLQRGEESSPPRTAQS